MSIEDNISALTQATTSLFNAVNVQKAALDTAVASAQTSASSANTTVASAISTAISTQVPAAIATAASSLNSTVAQASTAASVQNILTTPPTTLPYEVTAITGGVGTGTGGTPGEYVMGITGGPTGHQAFVTIDSTGKIASYRNANPGLSTASTLPTYSLSGVTGLTGATVPTATVGVIPVNRQFFAPTADGFQLQAWGNNAGVLASAPFGTSQVNLSTNLFDSSSTRYIFGKPVVSAMTGSSLASGWAVTTDGYLYSKPAIKIGSAANGLTWTQTNDGFWNLQLGTNANQLPVSTNGDVIDSTSVKYAYGKTISWAVADANNSVSIAVTSDGYLMAKLPIVLGNSNGLTFSRGNDGLYNLGFGTVQGQMPVSSGGDTIDSTAQRFWRGQKITWGVADASNEIAVAVDSAGNTLIPKLMSPAGMPKAHDSVNWFFDVQMINGFWQIFQTSKATGIRTPLTSNGNNVNPSIDATGQNVIYSTDKNGLTTPNLVYQPLGGGTEWSVFPSANVIDAWGDSLTAGAGSSGSGANQGPYPTQLAARLGRAVNNYGIGGQSSPQIAGRQGGAPCLVTVTGNQIPGTGSVVLTAYSVDLGYNSGYSGNNYTSGTLAGVPGYLVGNPSVQGNPGTATYAFTRTTAGSVTSCPPNTPFIPDAGVASRNHIQIIEVGRNNPTMSQVMSDIASMIGYQTSLIKKFIIMPIMNAVGEGTGTASYNNIMAINAALLAAYPNSFVDTRSPPTTAEMLALNYTPTTQDNTDISLDCIPTSMRYDGLHLVNLGYQLQTNRLYNFIIARGW